MSDFWSQVPTGPNMGNEGQYAGVPTGAQPTAANGYRGDFNLGGYQPQTPGFSNSLTPTAPNMGQMPLDSGFADSPRVTTQPQPWQQLDPNKPQGTPRPMPSGPTPDDPNYDWNTNPWGQEPGGITGWGAGGSRPVPGGLGNIGQMGPQGGMSMPPAIRMGPNGTFINPGNGSPYQGITSTLGQMGQKPMNPGQQSGQVGMRSPDGQHFQYVNAEHVPHYQGLGAQVYNGSSYGGGNG